jgi:hypothetical protein
LTSTKVTKAISSDVKKAYPGISKEELLKYSTHSIIMWPCVCLDEAGMLSGFIERRLR